MWCPVSFECWICNRRVMPRKCVSYMVIIWFLWLYWILRRTLNFMRNFFLECSNRLYNHFQGQRYAVDKPRSSVSYPKVRYRVHWGMLEIGILVFLYFERLDAMLCTWKHFTSYNNIFYYKVCDDFSPGSLCIITNIMFTFGLRPTSSVFVLSNSWNSE